MRRRLAHHGTTMTAPSPRVLLIVGGGIAAYKALELVRELQRSDIGVRAILTSAGARFVTPLSLEALTHDRVRTELFELGAESEMGHIELSRSADLVVVAPATADLIAKAANGHANDLASTALLATDKPVLMAPAMNVRMWQHPAVQRNVARLQADGVHFVGPDDGQMACGEFGPGRMAEPAAIAAQVHAMLGLAERTGTAMLDGRHAIVTAGPTREALDPVRYLSNHSSGQQGYAIAAALAAKGARVTLVSGPTGLTTPHGVLRVDVTSAREMMAAVEAALPADVFVGVAAVADWRPENPPDRKIKIEKAAGHALRLIPNPDILATVAALPAGRRPSLVVGFAAETHDVEAHAVAKRARKGCDWIVANDVSGDVMGGPENEAILITGEGATRWPRGPKTELARRLAMAIAGQIGGAGHR
jgi:phosphopantothenoylcysteine decarboxylase/phosphopantothenate--cysteine ligase